MIRRNWFSASSIPAAVQRSAISPDCQRLTLRLVRRTHSIIDSHGLVDSSVRFRLPRMPRRVSVSVSVMPSRSEPAAPGWGALELTGQRLQAIEGAVVVVVDPGGPEPALDGRAVALGQVVEHVSFLVADTALHGRLAEDGADCLAQRLGTVDHEQHPLLGVEAALDEF